MRIVLIEPFYVGSHKNWAEGYAKYSKHKIDIISMPGRYWKWRMHGGAVTIANRIIQEKEAPDLIVASDMVDFGLLSALIRRRFAEVPTALYFHENQLTYPWSNRDQDPAHKRDLHYGFINYSSALVADQLFFNSDYHRESFLSALPELLRSFPDFQELESVQNIADKSRVLHLGMELQDFVPEQTLPSSQKPATLLWNHRWEYDKNPKEFFSALYEVEKRGHDFRLILLGEQYREIPPEFKKAISHFEEKIIHIGYANEREKYISLVQSADILPVTSCQDFFGGSVVEAISCGVAPLLPNRLAFPEHIPVSQQRIYLYQGFDQFVEKLCFLIENYATLNKGAISQCVAKYDWQFMAPIYDEVFQNMNLFQK